MAIQGQSRSRITQGQWKADEGQIVLHHNFGLTSKASKKERAKVLKIEVFDNHTVT